jgi:hypothetical protein
VNATKEGHPMVDDSRPREVRLAENQVLYRNVNERIEDVNEVFAEITSSDGEWVCECADTNCTSAVKATLAEYEAVRANPRTFIVAPNHIFPDIERVVSGNGRFAVVEKIGTAGEIAAANDTRTEGTT